MKKTKFLCVCDGGNVRSVALAFELKHTHKQDAIAAGRWCASPDTLEMLCQWADVIVIMQPCMEESISPEYKAKLRCVDVGPDRYGVYIHPDLRDQTINGAKWLLDNLDPPLLSSSE